MGQTIAGTLTDTMGWNNMNVHPMTYTVSSANVSNKYNAAQIMGNK